MIKNSLTMVLVLLVLLACSNTNEPTRTQEDENKEIVLTFFNAMWNMEDLDALDQLLDPTYIDYAPSTNFKGKAYTPESMREGRKMFAQMMPDLRFEIDEVIAEGNDVVLFATSKFTHTNPTFTRLGMAAPTNKEIAYKTVFKYTVGNGKIVKGFDMHDMYNRSIQMGMIEPPSAN